MVMMMNKGEKKGERLGRNKRRVIEAVTEFRDEKSVETN